MRYVSILRFGMAILATSSGCGLVLDGGEVPLVKAAHPSGPEALDGIDSNEVTPEQSAIIAKLGLGPCESQCAGLRCVAGECAAYASCDQLHSTLPTVPSGIWTIDPDDDNGQSAFRAYCDMQPSGGYTLLMKVDGNKQTFAYDASLWTNDQLLNPTALDLDKVEAKLAGFTSLPISTLRISMETDGSSSSLELPLRLASTSMLALLGSVDCQIGGGKKSADSCNAFDGDSTSSWLPLVPEGDLPGNCRSAGVNVFSKQGGFAAVRIGVIANKQKNCNNADSVLGVGARPVSECKATAGNSICGPKNDDDDDDDDDDAGESTNRDVASFAYVFAR